MDLLRINPIKCVGGKRRVAHRILPHLDLANRSVLVVPFLGGGSVMLAARAAYPNLRVIAGDADADLMALWRMLATTRDTDALVKRLTGMVVSRAEYDTVKLSMPRDDLERAARIYYMIRVGYNGLRRRNGYGLINTPYGGDMRDLALDNLRRMAGASAGVELVTGDFTATLAAASRYPARNIVVYADPPYGAFRSYTAAGWTTADEGRMTDSLATWAYMGARVVISNVASYAATLGPDWHVEEWNVRRPMGAATALPGSSADEVLISAGDAR